MKPFTEHAPKPLVPVLNKPVLKYLFDDLAEVGVKRLVLNTHHFGEQVQEFCAPERARFEIQISHEHELLDNGGGLKNALPMVDRDVFYVLNGDCPLTNPPGLPYLARLAAMFDPDKMDMILLLQPNDARMITPFVGDYHLADDGRLTRALDQRGSYMFTGVRILHRRCIDTAPAGRYTFRDNMDAAQKAGRLFGLVHRGEWHHLSSLEDVRILEDYWQRAS
jgi:NDP-sugar pyrophosphorylase family protein